LIADRLKETFIFNMPSIEVIKAYNNKETLIYCDPPYLPSTRTAKEAYEFEMTEDEHIELSEVLNVFKGKAIISGYYSALYKDLYDGWTCKKKKISNHSGQNKTKGTRIECLWFNY
jgi:DNA adenine methylase